MFFKLLISFLSGILLINVFSCWDILSTVLCAVISNVIISHIYKKNRTYRTILFLTVALGAILTFYSQSYEANGLYLVDDKFAEITGYVYDIPQKQDDRYTYIIKTDGAKYKDKTYITNEFIRLNTDKKLKYAQNVSVRGFVERIDERMNYSDFDYASYLKSNEIFYKISDYDIATDNSTRNLLSPRHISNLYKNRISDLTTELGGDEGAILKAILTGIKTDFSEEYEDVLRRTNTIRMLYPAYLHVMLILFLTSILFTVFGRKTRDYASVIFIVFYACAFTSGISGTKTALALAFSILAIRKYGYLHYPDVLSLVLLILLVFNPLLVHNTGFVISAIMSWVFFMLKPVVYDKLKFIKSSGARTILTIYIISSLGIIPIGAYFFSMTSAYSGLLNIVYFPLVSLVLVFFPLLYLEFILFSRSFLIGKIMAGAIYLIHKMPYLIDKLPLSHIGIKRPSIVMVIICYLGVILIKDYLTGHKKRFRTQFIFAIIIGGLVSSALLSFVSYGSMSVSFVNVGQGDGAYIRLPDGANIIVDGGGGEDYSDYDAGKKLFLPYLKTEGAYRIDLAILSHYHRDHCLGTIAALENLDVQAVMMPDQMHDNEYREQIEALANEKGVEIIYPQDKDIIRFDSGAEIKIISAGNNYSENDSSLVFTLTCNNFSVMFTGDATEYTENKYINEFYDIDLLKVAHHGSKTSTSSEFLKEVKPEYAVISVGKDNTYLLPNDNTLERLRKSGAKIMRTDKLGDIRFNINKFGGISYNSYYPDNEEGGF